MKRFLQIASTLRHYCSPWHLRRALVFLWVDIFLLAFVPRGKSDSVLVVKFDQFGDYLLARNFLRRVRQCGRYKSRRVILCANRALRDFIELYDADAFDEIVWIDRQEMLNTVWARFRHLRRVKRLGAAVAIQFTYGLETFAGDCVVRASGAKVHYGNQVPLPANEDSEREPVRLGNRIYSAWVDPNQVVFDFYRHRALFSIAAPGVEPPRDSRFEAREVPAPEIDGPYAVIMPGASDAFREWPAERFGEVARHLAKTRGWRIVVLGPKADVPKAQAIASRAGDAVLDLCGRLTLPQVTWIASRCELGLTNDSGGIHLLAALGRPGVAISAAASFGYFHPYPAEISTCVTHVYPEEFYALALSLDERKARFALGKLYPITAITTGQVVDRVEALLHPPFRDPIRDIAPG